MRPHCHNLLMARVCQAKHAASCLPMCLDIFFLSFPRRRPRLLPAALRPLPAIHTIAARNRRPYLTLQLAYV